MIEIDGALHSGSGSAVRQAVAYAAVTGEPVRIVNVRALRPNPGLPHQHVQEIQAISQLVGGTVEGVLPGSGWRRLAAAGRHATVEGVEDTSAPQPGAAPALFADLDGGTRVGADGAGAPRRRRRRLGRG
jgi:hypothetical protein